MSHAAAAFAIASRACPTRHAVSRERQASSSTRHERPNARGRNFAVVLSATPSSSSADASGTRALAVFVSGGGSNMRAISDACERGEVKGRIAVVVTNAPDCGGARWARDRGIDVLIYPKKKATNEGLSADELVRALKDERVVDYVLLAGYLRLIPPELCRAYERRMVNIHPALLPAFGGKGMHGENVHKAVLASGVRFTGPTVHFVDEEFDKGKIVAQACVPVLDDDTHFAIAERVLEQEHRLFPSVVAALCDDRVRFREDGVPCIIDR